MIKTLLTSALVVVMLVLTACQTNTSTTDTGAWVRTAHKKDKAPPTENLWNVLGQDFESQRYWDNPRVQAQVEFYTKNKRFFDKMSSNAQPYLYHVYNEIGKADLPAEMVILPMVESTFDPYVYSSGKAAGIWQFVPGTGRSFGLRQSGSYDGRRDIYASTEAATKYLQRLNQEMNGDWLLVLASYNSGENAVKKAIEANQRRGKKTDYFSLDLSKETEIFVPRILAISKMLSDPEKYDLKLNYIPNSPYFTQVKLAQNSGFKQLSKSTGVDVAELKRLNPGYSKSANTVDKKYALLVPVAQSHQFDDSATPVSNTATDVPKVAATVAATEKTVSQSVHYTVKAQDNLWGIARKHHVSSQALAEANHINTNAVLHIGQQLTIPTEEEEIASTHSTDKVSYQIQSGDTLSAIARRFKVNIGDLIKWNPVIANKQKLALGDILYIYEKNH